MTRSTRGPLDEDELAELAEFLASDAVADTTMDVAMLDGFLTALASSPARPPLERWLPWVFDHERGKPRFELPPRQARTVTERIVRHLDGIALAIEEDPDEFEPLFYEREFDGVVLEVPDEWCTGFLVGVSLEAEAWRPLTDAHPELFRALRLHGTEAGWAELDAMEDLAERHEDFLDEIADAVREIQAHWRARRAQAPEPVAAAPQPPAAHRAAPKVGRNEPCPCGSGRKFKLCHGATRP